ncbi:MAG: hypothetical protein IGQ88_12765 [Gloeomargaritaceae cyanobacterium C42_A2020_066]|nr:hypothetical protein [Gloeomargaritaceae cyanobacterium C42_A2020_066]
MSRPASPQQHLLKSGWVTLQNGSKMMVEVHILEEPHTDFISIGIDQGFDAVSVQLTPEVFVSGNYDDVIGGLSLEQVKSHILFVAPRRVQAKKLIAFCLS